jgi:hypothetical protein
MIESRPLSLILSAIETPVNAIVKLRNEGDDDIVVNNNVDHSILTNNDMIFDILDRL